MNNFTKKLQAVEQDERKTSDELLPMVYEELRRLAAWKMSHEVPGHTLQATALVHEAWLRLGGQRDQHWQNRTHFFGAAAEAMRRILIESARRKKRLKHGGEYERVNLDHVELASPMPDEELLALDEALDKLAEIDGRAAEVVKLCFFAGLTQPQAAKELGISLAMVERRWAFARAWLFREIKNSRKLEGRSNPD